MSVAAIAGLGALLLAIVRRWRCKRGSIDLEAVVVCGALWLGAAGVLATLLATFGQFAVWTMAVACVAAAALAWPQGARPLARTPLRRNPVVIGLLLVGATLGLRLPPASHPLAGRDQGTYELRAEHTARTGSLGFVDPVLESAGAEVDQRPGPSDVLGLFDKQLEPWREGVYEAAYRPGLYLASRDRGEVVPQFLHLHPMLLATWRVAFGPPAALGVITLEGLLAVLALWCVGRRLWTAGPWPYVAAGVVALSPLAIWVHRNALTESLAQLLWWSALLAVLRARDGDRGSILDAAALLGLTTWLRGDAWFAAPLTLVVVWLSPAAGRERARPALIYLGLFVGSVAMHAQTTFPYLHDEIVRQLGLGERIGPSALTIVAAAGATAWWLVDRLVFQARALRTSGRLDALLRVAPRALTIGAVISIAGYVALRLTSEPRPFSRLDPAVPLLGIPLVSLAAVGLVLGAWRWRADRTVAQVWAIALATIALSALALYGQRNLPQAGLYYYGRYLVPVVLPAAALLATVAIESLHRRLTRLGALAAQSVTVAAVAGLAWSIAGVLVTHPQTRMQEFQDAARGVDWLAQRIPEGSVVIAGGEGWHHGHTFNQVGGALQLGRGRTVLPYRTAESAYATLHELLVARPATTGQPAPAVFLLLNEATHPYEREPDTSVAGLDDLLAAPFTATDIDMLELFVHRLTPVTDAVPTRVTRDGLRMALLRIEVDGARAGAIRTWRAQDGRLDGPAGLVHAGGDWRGGRLCLDAKEPVRLKLEPRATRGAGSLVVVADPGTSRVNHAWRIEVDGRRLATKPPRMTPTQRDTLGPFVLDNPPRHVAIRGSKQLVPGAPCPHGGLAQIRLLPPDVAALAGADARAVTIGPDDDRGHPYPQTGWVSARGLSRYRPGAGPDPELRVGNFVLHGNAPLSFAPASLPATGDGPVDVVVTLTRTQVDPNARLRISIDGELVTEVDPPDERDRSWISDPVRWTPKSATAAVTVELVHTASPDELVHLRDVGLFSTAAPVPSVMEP